MRYEFKLIEQAVESNLPIVGICLGAQVLANCAAVIEQELRDRKIEDTNLQQGLAEARLHSPAVAPIADRLMHHFLQSGGVQIHA